MIFHSQLEFYKFPFGSVMTGEKIRFTVVLPRAMRATGVSLAIREDSSAESRFFPFFWRSTDGETECWDCFFTPRSEGLYWYHFDYSVSWGGGHICPDSAGEGQFSAEIRDWQLTVYQSDFQTPDFLKGGILYQIFPDRFYNSGKEKKNIPYGRILRQDTENPPEWRPNREGKILNNDFFGGDLAGIEEKLPYLQSLGVTCIYLNPIFESHSNHRYDTADYRKIDPLLGDTRDFISLCEKAKSFGISVLIDGVFSHTGSDSVYFNKNGRYGEGGAYRDSNSPYAKWYTFGENRDDYKGWWGFDTLPEVNENEPSFTEFITGENGVLDFWLKNGASGVRLDVADELPDAFLDKIREIAKKNQRNAFVLGEVWEDATNKFSYGHRRRYLLGKQLDSVMNYPFREAILQFIKTKNAQRFQEKILSIVENYPPPALHTMMNLLGTHDTERILTALTDRERPETGEKMSRFRLSEEERKKAVERLQFAAVLLYTLPGVPCIYYGDEAGMEGCRDPFNRGFYPWGRENTELLAFFRELGEIRRRYPVFQQGRFLPLSAALQCVAYLREDETGCIAVIANANPHEIDYYINRPHKERIPILNAEITQTGVKIPAEKTAIVELD